MALKTNVPVTLPLYTTLVVGSTDPADFILIGQVEVEVPVVLKAEKMTLTPDAVAASLLEAFTKERS